VTCLIFVPYRLCLRVYARGCSRAEFAIGLERERERERERETEQARGREREISNLLHVMTPPFSRSRRVLTIAEVRRQLIARARDDR